MLYKLRFYLLILFLLGITAPPFSLAEPRKNTPTTVPQPIQEMFQSNLVYPQEEDEIQLPLFPSFRKDNNSERSRTLFEVEYGITDAFQIILEWDGLVYKNPDNNSTHSGPGDIELGA